LNPSFALAHYGLGVALVLSGKPSEAIAELDAARRLSPHDPYLWAFAMFCAWAHLVLGDRERAIEEASVAVRQPRAPFPAWSTLASVLGSAGRIDEARAALAKALELEPGLEPAIVKDIWPNLDPVLFERYCEGLRGVAPVIPAPDALIRERNSGGDNGA